MASSFNTGDRESWYCGKLSRKDTQDRLQGKSHGTFLVRDSNTCPGDYVLSVSENSKVSHYIINQMKDKLKIGEQEFVDLPALLEFYKVHYLDTTTLIQPASVTQEKVSVPESHSESVPDGRPVNGVPEGNKQKELVIAQFEFKSDDSEDLPFKKGEILEVVNKLEENWWIAKNGQGKTGQIPVPYVKVHRGGNRKSTPAYQQPPISVAQQNRISLPDISRQIVYAKAKMKRVPSAYDPSALALEIGDVVLVTKMNQNGQWEGRIGTRTGTFPFTHVELMDNYQEKN